MCVWRRIPFAFLAVYCRVALDLSRANRGDAQETWRARAVYPCCFPGRFRCSAPAMSVSRLACLRPAMLGFGAEVSAIQRVHLSRPLGARSLSLAPSWVGPGSPSRRRRRSGSPDKARESGCASSWVCSRLILSHAPAWWPRYAAPRVRVLTGVSCSRDARLCSFAAWRRDPGRPKLRRAHRQGVLCFLLLIVRLMECPILRFVEESNSFLVWVPIVFFSRPPLV